MRTLFSLLMLVWAVPVFAQPTPDSATHRQALLIKKYFNQKRTDSLYGLMAPSFKEAIKEDQLKQLLQTQLAPYGNITGFEYVSQKQGVHKYKTVFAAGITLQTMVGLNPDGLVENFAMQPYKQDNLPQKTTVYSSNLLRTPMDSAVDKIARSYILDTIAKGMSIAIWQNGQKYYYHYGLADVQTGRTPGNQTGYEIGSITKTFTALLLARAVVAGKIALDSPITRYLPDSVAANKALEAIKVVHLANHTSGLPRLPLDLYAIKGTDPLNPYALYDDKQLYKGMKTQKPQQAPGTKYEYSNYAMGILGTILGRLYKKPWQQLVQENIVQPMGISQTTAWNDLPPGMATGYNEKGAPTPYWDFAALAAAGSIRSNAADLLTYGINTLQLMEQSLGAGPLLAKPTYQQYPTTVTLGWHCNHNGTGKGPIIFSHDGGTYGFRTHLSVCPAQQWVAVVLTNLATDPGASEVGAKIDAWLSK